MPSTSAPVSNLIAGYTDLPGLQVSPYGAIITQMKVYNFGLTDTGLITTTSTARSVTVSGLTTNDVPVHLSLTTGFSAGPLGQPHLRVSAANTLEIAWPLSGTTSTGGGTAGTGVPGVVAPGASATLLTYSYFAQSASTTT